MQALSEENYLLRFITKRESKLLSATVFSVASGLKFIYSEKATEFCEIFPLLLTVCTVVKSKGKISQNFVAFSEYMNFMKVWSNHGLAKISGACLYQINYQ